MRASELLPADVGELSAADYERFRELIYRTSGIHLGDKKMQLVHGRLGKRMREGGFRSFHEYYKFVESDTSGQELCTLLDAISTNTTHLFREAGHFDFLRTLLHQWVEDGHWRAANKGLRIWSSACSSGDEPYSIAMTVREALAGRAAIDVKILATDISTRMLARASAGRFDPIRVGKVPAQMRSKYFQPVKTPEGAMLEVVPEIRRMITFTRFNLMEPTFPFRHGFNVIFCRNVMIYFDRPTIQSLVMKFSRHLRPDGHLLIGHAESLTGVTHQLEYVQPTIYRKAAR